jgi:hypothetical protein
MFSKLLVHFLLSSGDANANALAKRIMEWLVLSTAGSFSESVSFVLEVFEIKQLKETDAALLCSLAIRFEKELFKETFEIEIHFLNLHTIA